MNTVIETILSRRSIRSYENKQVPREDLETLVRCGMFAPSSQNTQPWHFTIVRNRGVLDRISAENRKMDLRSDNEKVRKNAEDPAYDNFRGAPCAIVVSYDLQKAKTGPMDCANAMMNMSLAAESLGLANLYIASFNHAFALPGVGQELCALLELPAGYQPQYALAVGYGAAPASEPRQPRKENMVTVVE